MKIPWFSTRPLSALLAAAIAAVLDSGLGIAFGSGGDAIFNLDARIAGLLLGAVGGSLIVGSRKIRGR